MTNRFPRRPGAAAIVLATTMAVLAAGCATPYREPVSDPPDAHYDGIVQIAAREPVAPGERQAALDVFIVHGMCHHDADWALGWIDRLAHALGAPANHLRPPDPQPPNEIKAYRAEIALGDRMLRVHALVWSGLTRPLKEQLCYDERKKTESCDPQTMTLAPLEYPYSRARLNSRFKDELMNECVSDALIYQGQARGDMLRAMQGALLESRAIAAPAALRQGLSAARASLANEAGLVVIASSLGSKMVFDAIIDLESRRGDDGDAGRRLHARTRQIFLAANQIPLLGLADQRLPGLAGSDAPRATSDAADTPFPADPLEFLFGQRSRALFERAANDNPGVVAFSDPNDVLSYPLRGYYRARKVEPSYPLVDVIVSNAPTVLGLFENPARAHGGYPSNDDVLARIACGDRGWGGCR
ncbi:hypothetical protein [Piscinibacter koreensis]|uniref:Uncharacterized protein n=1 Tax=Piscinibacter koreensis TaxID=2742824 RepID=A0A7Y6TYE7_9BURK|nr:hypothetical protein [Schlegelella koreensis]NUZ08045.1 hypothetical protein [Schlegelella koreensis]